MLDKKTSDICNEFSLLLAGRTGLSFHRLLHPDSMTSSLRSAIAFVISLLVAPVSALAGQHSANVGELIQCPDWRLYAPPLVRNTEAPEQTPQVLETPTPPPQSAPNTTADQTCSHVIADGETLAQIAARHLGAASRWQEIVAANPDLDPVGLAIGRSIMLPCHPSSGVGQGVTTPQDPQAVRPRNGLWATLFGGRSGVFSPTASDQVAPVSGPVVERQGEHPAPAIVPRLGSGPAAPPAPPAPIWTAGQGEFLDDILLRWGQAAGWTVLIDTHDSWRLQVPVQIQGEFEEAVAELIRGLGHGGVPPRVRTHPNKVLRLGGPL